VYKDIFSFIKSNIFISNEVKDIFPLIKLEIYIFFLKLNAIEERRFFS